MTLAKCERCGNLFSRVSDPVCPECREAENKEFERVIACLDENPDLNAAALAERAGVSIDYILRLVELGRISHVAPDNKVRCGRCGAPAISRRTKLCKPCLHELMANVAEEMAELKAKAGRRTALFGRPQETIERIEGRKKTSRDSS